MHTYTRLHSAVCPSLVGRPGTTPCLTDSVNHVYLQTCGHGHAPQWWSASAISICKHCTSSVCQTGRLAWPSTFFASNRIRLLALAHRLDQVSRCLIYLCRLAYIVSQSTINVCVCVATPSQLDHSHASIPIANSRVLAILAHSLVNFIAICHAFWFFLYFIL